MSRHLEIPCHPELVSGSNIKESRIKFGMTILISMTNFLKNSNSGCKILDMADINNIPWKYLEDFRGTDFKGEWPTFPELVHIQAKRNGERPCFTAFDGPEDSKRTLTYTEVLAYVQ